MGLPEHTAESYCCRRKGENGHSQVNDVMLQGGLHNHQIGHTIILNQQGHIFTTFALAQAPLDLSICSYSTTQPTKNQNKTKKHTHLEATKATETKTKKEKQISCCAFFPSQASRNAEAAAAWASLTSRDTTACWRPQILCPRVLLFTKFARNGSNWYHGELNKWVCIYIYMDICVRKTLYLSIL